MIFIKLVISIILGFLNSLLKAKVLQSVVILFGVYPNLSFNVSFGICLIYQILIINLKEFDKRRKEPIESLTKVFTNAFTYAAIYLLFWGFAYLYNYILTWII